MIRQELAKIIEAALRIIGSEVPEVEIERPENEIHGDYSTNIAFKLSKHLKKDPMSVASLLAGRLKEYSFLENVEAVKPGFINFFISKEYLQDQVWRVLSKKEKFGQLKIGRGRRVQVEFISANPTGPLTVGNSRGGPFGDTLANVLKKAGFKVEKAYYINDYGSQILALGHSVLQNKEAQYKGVYIEELKKRIKDKDPYKAGEKAAKIIVKEMIKKTIDRLGIKYDQWLSETWLHKNGWVDKALKRLEAKNLLYQKEGALFFKSSKFGDERDRVLVKADGWKTYLAGDIGYHLYKFEKKRFDKVINVWGADHYGDVPGLLAAVEALGHEGKLDFILLQFVTVLEKGRKLKMSKRRGFFVTMDDLLDAVGKDVVRFFFLEKSPDTHLNFDLGLAKEQSEKNPVYYLQYSHARICSILRKAKSQKPKVKNTTKNLRLLNHKSELALIKQLIQFPEVIEDIAKDYQVQRLPQYALDLAVVFNQFYRDCRVLTEDSSLQQARLALVSAARIVLKNALDLMGISAPEKM